MEVYNKIIEPLELRKKALEIISIFSSLGYRLIRIKIHTYSPGTIQFMIERNDLKNITISDCARVNKQLFNLVDKNSFLQKFSIEVSSPGINRPLIEYKDFVRFIGSKVKIELNLKIKDDKNYLGIIFKCDDGNIELIEDKTKENLIFNISEIKNASLIEEKFCE